MDSVINASGIGVWDWNIQIAEVFCNARWAEILGYSLDELQPLSIEKCLTLLHPDDLVKNNKLLEKHWQGEVELFEIEFRMKHKQGHYVWILSTGKTIERLENGEPCRMIGIHIDITQRKHDEEDLVTTSHLLDQTQKIAKVGGWELDVATGHLFWTAETYRILETSPEEFDPSVDSAVSYFLPESQRQLKIALDDAINLGKNYDLELQTYTLKGRLIDVRATCVVMMEGTTPIKLTGIFQDIGEQKAIQRKLEEFNNDLANVNEKLKLNANYDALTGLPNRNLLADRMQQSIMRNELSPHHIAIAFIDLDGFKEINDLHGHGLGDDLLRDIAKKINDSLRPCDTLARFGGDEFIMILDELSDPDECTPILKNILELVADTIFINQKAIKVTASIGVTVYPQDKSNPDQLIRHADQAMYIAKQSGKNCLHIFDVAKDVAATHQFEELENIRAALKNNEFVLYYQPKINMKTNEVIGLEALIRWQHPQLGLLPPVTFLPIIEYNILNIELGEWVIKSALNQLSSWSDLGLDLPISVNISPLQLQHPDFVNRLQLIFQKYPSYQAGRIEFEILETSALDEIEQVAELIAKCHELGIVFSIDDFGTGYSSLTYLKRLPTECLKIDRSFVIDMLDDRDDRAIVLGVIQLAKTFERSVIAEGVETIAHGEQLLSLGCHLAQGFGISKPMPEENFPQWLEKWKAQNEWQVLAD